MTIYVPGKLTFKKETVAADPYFNNVSLLLHGDGANGSTTIIDSSPSPKTVTAVGNAQISTAQSKFGGSSLLFSPGEINPLSVPASSDLQLNSALDFTVEAWIYLNSNRTYNYFVSKGGFATREWAFAAGPTNLTFFWSTSGTSGGDQIVSRAVTLPLSTWMHIAAVKHGSAIKLFKDGVQAGADGTFTSIFNGNNTFWVGRFMDYTNISHDLDGYIDDLRITKGVARYTANFTPPTAPFPEVLG